MSWRTLTYFGDSMLLIPTACIIALFMAWKSEDRRTVWYWILAFCMAGSIVSISKIAFMGFGIGNVRFNFTGFSGHSAMSATFWPVIFWLFTSRFTPFWRVAAIGIGYLLPLLVGVSRLELNAHSTSEVLTGLLIGFTLSTLFLLSQRYAKIRHFTLPQLSAILLLPLLIMGHGRIATTQSFLEHLSMRIAGLDKPWTRADLLKLHSPGPKTMVSTPALASP
ncbi:hypothetical protein ED28_14745 [[Pantoea] beijingensis]|uniref:Phosphatidic acid phosphatase type 2/haloperoxidase domain-containing protein n=1 Tax=[Pantoea] beijingensis TaxID=1324864 RepID=A0A443IB95_9GAMM|nr:MULTISPECIES: phosphatase PAP2 family protein [Erwiniaceae]RWR01176.1 hypothetical protein ED28_14745 [[Pantoea] beijingensis]